MGIYLMRKDGTHVRRITNTPDRAKQDVFPRFSPNGKSLVFTRLLGFADDAPAALFKVRRDGTHLQRLTSYSMRAGDEPARGYQPPRPFNRSCAYATANAWASTTSSGTAIHSPSASPYSKLACSSASSGVA